MHTDATDLHAAWIRKAGEGQQDTFQRLFFSIESYDIPWATVEYTTTGFFKKQRTPHAILIQDGHTEYRAQATPKGIQCQQRTIVHGVQLNAQALEFSRWIDTIMAIMAKQGSEDRARLTGTPIHP